MRLLPPVGLQYVEYALAALGGAGAALASHGCTGARRCARRPAGARAASGLSAPGGADVQWRRGAIARAVTCCASGGARSRVRRRWVHAVPAGAGGVVRGAVPSRGAGGGGLSVPRPRRVRYGGSDRLLCEHACAACGGGVRCGRGGRWSAGASSAASGGCAALVPFSRSCTSCCLVGCTTRRATVFQTMFGWNRILTPTFPLSPRCGCEGDHLSIAGHGSALLRRSSLQRGSALVIERLLEYNVDLFVNSFVPAC